MSRLILACTLVVPAIAWGDGIWLPGRAQAQSVSTAEAAAMSSAERAAGDLMPENFGAKGDGLTDDTAAFVAYSQYIHTQYAAGRPPRVWNLGHGKVYVVHQSIDLTGLSYMRFEGNGSLILGSDSGYPILDMQKSKDVVLANVGVYAGSQASPQTVGIRLGVVDDTQGYAENTLENVSVDGYYTLAAVHNRGSELFAINPGTVLINRYTPSSGYSYSLIEDGTAHWPFASRYVTSIRTPDKLTSFLQHTYTGAKFYNKGGGPALWMSGASQVVAQNIYLQTTGTVPEIQIYMADSTGTAATLRSHWWNLHSEIAPSSVFQFYGAPPTIHGLDFYEQNLQATGSVFSLGTSATRATIDGLTAKIGTVTGSPTLVDTPLAYSLNGDVTAPLGVFNALTSAFQGTSRVPGVTTYFGVSQTALPTALQVSSLYNAGGVTGLAIMNPNGNQYGGVAFTSGTLTFPTCSLSAPPAAGSQATCTVTSMGVFSAGTVKAPGLGYAVNDTLTENSATCSDPPQWRVTSVFGGAVTAVAALHIGSCSAIPAVITMTGGAGTGVSLTGIGWRVIGLSYTAGAGYVAPPSVTFTTSSVNFAYTATGRATISSTMSIQAGRGLLVMNGVGTNLGIAGASGYPAISQGALIDGSGVRVSLSSTYTVPANTSLVRLTQAGTVLASTVTLPTALADGQPIQFVNYAGSVTALTFSPAVNGWTNGGTLPANTGLRVRWDATSVAWYREQ